MVLTVVAPHKAYYDILFEDIPPEYILGGACLCCGRMGPVNRELLERRFGANCRLRLVDGMLKCRVCKSRHHNRFVIYGKKLRERVSPALWNAP